MGLEHKIEAMSWREDVTSLASPPFHFSCIFRGVQLPIDQKNWKLKSDPFVFWRTQTNRNHEN